MKQLMLVILLLAPSIGSGEWNEIGSTVDGNTYFIDAENISKREDYTYFWVLTNFANVDRTGARSFVSYYRADCEVFKINGLSMSLHSERYGMGKEIKRYNDLKLGWDFPRPKTMNHKLITNACQY